jgi:hypothetical protein
LFLSRTARMCSQFPLGVDGCAILGRFDEEGMVRASRVARPFSHTLFVSSA